MGLKKLLITGSNGLLGQKLIELVLKNYPEFELIATSRGRNRIKKYRDFIYESVELTNKTEVDQLFSKHEIDTVIHTAAMTNVDLCEVEQEACWKANVESVKHLCDNCEKCDSHFIHLSTDFIFDGKNGPYKEDDEAAPLSYYGESKLASENIVKSMKTKWAIARTIIVYGVVEDMSRSNIVLWAKNALGQGKPLNIVNDQYRSPTLAEDLAIGCMLIAEKGAEGVYHLSGKETMSIVDLVRRVARYYELDESLIKEISSANLNQAAKRPPRTGFIIDKAKQQLGYHPRSFEEGIALMEKQLAEKS